MNLILVIGFLAIVTSMTRLLPQVIKGYKTKKVRDVSLAWEILGLLSAILYFIYSYLISDKVIMIGSGVTFIFYVFLIHQKITYGKLGFR